MSEPTTLARTAIPARPPWAALAFAVAFPTALTLAYFVLLADRPRSLVQAVYAFGKAIQFGFPLAWVAWSTGRFPRPSPPRLRGAGAGLAFGLAALACTLTLYGAVLRPAGVMADAAAAVQAKVAALGVATPARFLALAVFYSVLHSAAEEYYWRWFVFGELRRAWGAGLATAGSSAAFAAHHVVLLGTFFGWGSPWTPALAVAVAAGGAFWAWLYDRSGSLFGPWLGHLLVDAAIFAVGWQLLS